MNEYYNYDYTDYIISKSSYEIYNLIREVRKNGVKTRETILSHVSFEFALETERLLRKEAEDKRYRDILTLQFYESEH